MNDLRPMQRERPLHMLVADRSPDSIRAILKAVDDSPARMVLTIAENGKDCLKTLKSGHVDVAFLADSLPGTENSDFASEIKAIGSRTLMVRMLAGSSGSEGNSTASTRDLKVYEQLIKPIAPERVMPIFDNFRRMRERTSILLVDGSASTRRIIRRVLARSIFSLSVDDAESGNSAVERFRRGHHDVVMIDTDLADMSGREVAAALQVRTQSVSIVLLTSGRDDRAPAPCAEADDTWQSLRKPFFVTEFDRVLHRALALAEPSFYKAPADTAFI